MKIPMLSCGIFKYELEAARADIERELGAELAARFLPPALDLDFVIMEAALREELDGSPTALLYGSMCHPQLTDIAAQVGADLPCRANCAAMFLPTERNAELAADGNVFFLTLGGLRQWRDIYIGGHGWDDFDARSNFGYIDRIILLDSGVFEYTDEEIFDFYEFTQTPIEVEPISLDFFTQNVVELCCITAKKLG